MRLGVLGPAQGDLPALAVRVQRLLDEQHAEKVIYLADDDALEHIVASWARGIVGDDDMDEHAVFERAATRCTMASSEAIDEFVASERARLRLKVLVSLPETRRLNELLGGRVALFVYDGDALNEDDLAGASLVVFGKSEEPVLKRVGARLHIAPGAIDSKTGGCALLDDGSGSIRIEIVSSSGEVTAREIMAAPSAAARMWAHGNSKL
ncbi:MAG: hypothetical protein HUU21_19495 [Polyangiaceae bacterium]|nr:metallophosphatase family protein [Polyangiaceae bacterium]NUQ75733.1 hypothetical protein [Polyangiaceae bacterium]